LDVKVPLDKEKAVTASFYALWCGNSTARVGTNGMPVVPAQAIKAAVTELGAVIAGFEVTGLLFGGLEGGISIKDVALAVRDKRAAARRLSANREPYGRAIDHLALYRGLHPLRKQERLERQLVKQAMAGRASHAVAADLEPLALPTGQGAEHPVDLHPDQAGPGAPSQHDEGAVAEQWSAASADTSAARQRAAAGTMPIMVRTRAASAGGMPGFRTGDCDGYLAFVDASGQYSKARACLWSNIIACIRDFGVQGARVVIDTLKKTGEIVVPPCLGPLLPWIASIGMGVFHGVAAVLEWWQANRALAHAEQVLQQADRNEESVRWDAKRHDRVTNALALKVLEHFRQSMSQAREHAVRHRRWAICRFIYGGFSTASGTGAIVTGAVFGVGALIGTGGMILSLVAIATGVGWLAFAVYKIITRMRMEKVQRVEREEVRAALEEAVEAMGGFEPITLEQCDLGDLDTLVSGFKLEKNRYLKAAQLAKLLLMESEEKEYSTKQERLEVSTTLQVMGMTKAMTSILKRASFERAHETVYGYLRGDAAQHAMSADAFNNMAPIATSHV
jgi:hypothetical protein